MNMNKCEYECEYEYEYATHDNQTIIPFTSSPMPSYYTIPAPYSGVISGERDQ
jgi:hypothetical protein